MVFEFNARTSSCLYAQVAWSHCVCKQCSCNLLALLDQLKRLS